MLAKVTSLFDLFNKARTDKRYERLAIIAAKNLGGSVQTLEEAKQWLNMTANDVGDCRGVVEEVNFCRDLVVEEDGAKKPKKKFPKFKIIKERDVIDSNNYIRYEWTTPSMTYSDAIQELGRVQRQAQEQNVAVMTAQQQPASSEFVPIADDFVLDDFSITERPTDPTTIIQNASNNEGIICRWPESPYRPDHE